METTETIYKYFELALSYILNGPNAIERKKLAGDAKISVQYLSQILNPKRCQKASLRAQKKIAAAAGFTYETFLERGKNILHYGRPTVGARMLNQIYERIDQIMNSLKLNKDQLILKSQISTPIQKAWHFIGDPPDPDDIEKIANATGYSKEWILNGRGPLLSEGKTIVLNDHRKPEDLPHDEIITRFKDKEWARKINAMLLEIENDPEQKDNAGRVLTLMVEHVRSKKIPQKNE